MKEMRETTVTLVLRLEDFTTGRLLTPDDITVSGDSGYTCPIFKEDGFFVFTGIWPESVVVSSETYLSIAVSPVPDHSGVYRLALLPASVRQSVHELQLNQSEIVFAGCGGPRAGYVPTEDINENTLEIALQKSDMTDITSAWHLLLGRDDSEPEPVFITQNLGYGKYRLLSPVQKTYAARGCRLIPLHRLIGIESGVLGIPILPGATALYVMEPDNKTVTRIGAEVL